jgi:hypothetical protein
VNIRHQRSCSAHCLVVIVKSQEKVLNRARYDGGRGHQEDPVQHPSSQDKGWSQRQGVVGSASERRVPVPYTGDTLPIAATKICDSCFLTLCVFFPHQYVQKNKAEDNDWFRLESNKEGTKWFGKCWYVQDMLKYEFDVEFDVRFLKTNFLFQIN